MQYREVGKTGIKASVIGLGEEGIAQHPYPVVEEVIHGAMDAGVNIIDCFMPGKEIRENIGRALRGRREKVLLQGHIGSTDIHEQNDVSRDLAICKKYFESLLADLGTDYVDFGMFFFVDTPGDYQSVFEGELLEYARDLKKRGIIRAIGASCHNSVTGRRIAESGCVDLIMFSVNPVFDMTPPESDIFELLDGDRLKTGFSFKIDENRAALYRICAEREVGITVMKTFCAGKLLSAEFTPFSAPMTTAQCIHYALTRPAVASVLLGCQSMKELSGALAYLDMSDEERDYSGIIETYQGGFKGNCMYCNHCLPCPVSIDVAAVTKYLDIAALHRDNIPAPAVQHYLSLEKHGSDCVSCGSCENRCPFSVPVIGNMKKAAELFGV
ncbi:MAG: aldo/keto reductase [Treponema sp.]|jgi:predicted aldo/keto reductase-like oxidoreductase|nr:aldo/keto reductase [Treponema sp.]